MLRKLAGQTAIYGFSTIGVRLLNYLLTPYLTRIMNPEVYGVVTDIYSLIPFLLVILTMGLETGFFRFIGKCETIKERNNVFQTTWAAVTGAALLFLTGILLFNRPIAGIMGYAAHPSYVWMMGGIVALDVITAIPFAKLRAENKSVRFVGIRFIQAITNIVLCLFLYSVLPRIKGLSAWWSPEFGAGYYLIANLAASFIALALLFPAYKGCPPRMDRKLFKTIMLYSLPLLIAAIPGVANEFIDRQFIKYLMPEEIALSSLGIYGAVTKLAVIMTLFVQMYRYAAEPFFLANFKQEEFKSANAQTMKYFTIVSVLVFLGITYFSDLLAYFIGADFRVGMFILPIVLLSNIFAGIVLNLSFWYKHSGLTKYAVVITGVGFVITVLLNLALIPKLGYIGAAWARLGCEFMMVLISYRLCRKYYPIPYDLKRIGGYFLVGAAAYGLGMAANEYTCRFISILLELILLGGFCIFVVRVEKINVRAMLGSFRK